eukprot:scaffold40_cov305-Pinguiococcus_pyrenoidosus.AAC.12
MVKSAAQHSWMSQQTENIGKWNQLFALGGEAAPCALHVRIPAYYVRNRSASRKPAMCFREDLGGVAQDSEDAAQVSDGAAQDSGASRCRLITASCDDSDALQEWRIRAL